MCGRHIIHSGAEKHLAECRNYLIADDPLDLSAINMKIDINNAKDED